MFFCGIKNFKFKIVKIVLYNIIISGKKIEIWTLDKGNQLNMWKLTSEEKELV